MTQTYSDTARDLTAEQYVPSFVERWDELINWDRRAEGESGFFVETLRAAGARRVLDVAAGTGFHSILLSEAGFDVLAVDGSEDMLRTAERNARARGTSLATAQADWRTLTSSVTGRYDAIICLGSSFPHLFDESDRRQALREFHSVLAPGGVLIIDHRNFDAIRQHRYRSTGNYYYCGANVAVSVDHIVPTLCRFRYDFADQETYYLEVYPVLRAELRSLLRDSGFADVRTFGDFKADADPLSSDFVIHVATKSAGAV